jgi:hypothetical protein
MPTVRPNQTAYHWRTYGKTNNSQGVCTLRYIAVRAGEADDSMITREDRAAPIHWHISGPSAATRVCDPVLLLTVRWVE